MCGRFTLRAPASAVAEQFGLFDAPPFSPRFNVAPPQAVLAVRLAPNRPDDGPEFAWLRWGLVPSWAEDHSIGNRMINARAETVTEKPAFRSAFRRRRCLIVADGFYEWKKQKGTKQPYFFRLRDDRPFAFAGLWDSWEGAQHSALESCTILTTDSNELVAPVHDRMPVIVPASQYGRWLDWKFERAEEITPLLRPYPAEEMEAYPVSPHVNSPANEDSQCVERSA